MNHIDQTGTTITYEQPKLDDDYLRYLVSAYVEPDDNYDRSSVNSEKYISEAADEPETEEQQRHDGRKKYRTRKAVDGLQDMPGDGKLVLISRPVYQAAISFDTDKDRKAHMVLTDLDFNHVQHDGGEIFESETCHKVNIDGHITQEGINKIDIPLLVGIYTIMRYCGKTDRLKLYIPELMRFSGVCSKASSEKSFASMVHRLTSFNGLIGIINEKREGGDRMKQYPVLLLDDSSERENTVTLSSPYFEQIINAIDDDAIERDRKGKVAHTKSGLTKKDPSHSYLVASSIIKEKCKPAVVNVFLITTLIEQAGSHTPHIKIRTLMERNRQMKQQIDGIKTTSGKNKALKKIFKKTWDLMREKTRIESEYTNIKIPGLIPKVSDMDVLLEFPHDDKKPNPNEEMSQK